VKSAAHISIQLSRTELSGDLRGVLVILPKKSINSVHPFYIKAGFCPMPDVVVADDLYVRVSLLSFCYLRTNDLQ